jgi:hypothetical protein
MRSCRGRDPDESFRSGTSRRRSSALATFRVLAEGDLDADAALAFAVGSPAAAEVADAAPATALRAEGPCCARVGAAEIVRKE